MKERSAAEDSDHSSSDKEEELATISDQLKLTKMETESLW